MIHYNILDKERQEILPYFAVFKENFYLAGGTGLALQIGHRDSIDFDFFSESKFDTKILFLEIENLFKNKKITKIQEEEGTLTIIIDDRIKVSFFYYPYKVLIPLINEQYLKIASIIDIAVMKVSAIVSRATLKDYVDMFFIFNSISFEEVINYAHQKLPTLDENLIRKSMVYFEDVAQEKILFKTEKQPKWTEIKQKMEEEVLGDKE